MTKVARKAVRSNKKRGDTLNKNLPKPKSPPGPAADQESLGLLYVARSVWRGFITDPKTEKSKAPVPVIPQLAARLDSYRKTCGQPSSGAMFANGLGNPLDLEWLYRTHIKDVLRRAGVQWTGWHAFRRGLASNLNRLGVDDSIIQSILRHSTVARHRHTTLRRHVRMLLQR